MNKLSHLLFSLGLGLSVSAIAETLPPNPSGSLTPIEAASTQLAASATTLANAGFFKAFSDVGCAALNLENAAQTLASTADPSVVALAFGRVQSAYTQLGTIMSLGNYCAEWGLCNAYQPVQAAFFALAQLMDNVAPPVPSYPAGSSVPPGPNAPVPPGDGGLPPPEGGPIPAPPGTGPVPAPSQPGPSAGQPDNPNDAPPATPPAGPATPGTPPVPPVPTTSYRCPAIYTGPGEHVYP